MNAAGLVAAADRRAVVGTDVVRLVDDAADDCPDVVVDRYGPVLRFEIRGARWPDGVDAHARDLCAHVGAAHAVGLLRTSAGKSALRVLHGDPPRAHVVTERGVRLLVRTVDEEAAGTGVFVDHREGRAMVRARARGGVVLNLFAHAGAFGAFAAVGGASRVDHVDAARKCAPWAALNLALNGEDPRKHRFLVDDALAVVAKRAKRAEATKGEDAYDVIICDPPTTALRPDGTRFHVEKHLGELARDCLRALRPGGALVLSTNHRGVSVRDVEQAARTAADDAGRSVKSVDEVELPPDLPSARDPRLRPMRGVLLTLA